MQNKEQSTQERILEAAKAEFLEKDFGLPLSAQSLKPPVLPPERCMAIMTVRKRFLTHWWKNAMSIFCPRIGMHWMTLAICRLSSSRSV